ncbi:hypothetical protein C8R44DRAFT_733117 [Mycena epipterygia]|nr:hypothetical protein C8R44DRAFT_733117 [Mycena epipterygia]
MTPTTISNSILFSHRYAIVAYSFLKRFSLLLFSHYIPRAVFYRTTTTSGIDLLPFMLSVVATIISSGQLIANWPFLIVSPMFLGIGSGLLYILNTHLSFARFIGFQILAGVGTGMGMQNSLLAMQVEFHNNLKLLGQATSIASFGQFLGGTLEFGVAERVFSSGLTKRARGDRARESYAALLAAMIRGVVQSYLQSLRIVLVLGVPVAGLALFSALFIQKILIGKAEEPPAAAKPDAEKALEA